MGLISPSVPLFFLQSSFFLPCPPFFLTFLSLFFSLSFCPLPPPAHFSPLFGPHYSFRIPLFSIQSSSLLSLFPFSPPIVLPSSASLFCPPNGSHYSFRPCPSSIQSWSSLPPSSPSIPFPLPPFILFPMSDPFFSA